MGWYSRWVFPQLIEWTMAGEPFSHYRRQVLAEVTGEVLEIGFGTGLNLAYYPAAVASLTVIAAPRIAQQSLPVTSKPLRGESLALADNQFDWVISTWTLCSIADIHQALAEIRRVLKPGGKFGFIEHGLSPDPTLQRWQHRLTPLQKRIADGCHLDRAIADLVQAYLPLEKVDTFYADDLPKVGGYFYRGVAVKPSVSPP